MHGHELNPGQPQLTTAETRVNTPESMHISTFVVIEFLGDVDHSQANSAPHEAPAALQRPSWLPTAEPRRREITLSPCRPSWLPRARSAHDNDIGTGGLPRFFPMTPRAGTTTAEREEVYHDADSGPAGSADDPPMLLEPFNHGGSRMFDRRPCCGQPDSRPTVVSHDLNPEPRPEFNPGSSSQASAVVYGNTHDSRPLTTSLSDAPERAATAETPPDTAANPEPAVEERTPLNQIVTQVTNGLWIIHSYRETLIDEHATAVADDGTVRQVMLYRTAAHWTITVR